MKRTTCSACGGTDLEQFLDLGESPIADAYTAAGDDPPDVYPLQVAVCAKCRLVQLLEVVDQRTLFGTGYSFYSSASPPLSAYHQRYAGRVLARHLDLAKRGVVEVGCNDGDLLRHFAAAGCPTLGVDPATGPVGAARERGLDVLCEPFGLAVGQRIRDERGPAGLVIANHVLAHVEDVADLLAGVAVLLADDGTASVEVQYLPDLIVNNAFDLIYHEHRNFFSLTSLEQAASIHGLHITAAMLTDRQAGSLRVTLARKELSSWVRDDIRMSEGWLADWSAYAGMQGRAERIRMRLRDLIAARQPGTFAGYGAPAKATTLLNFCGIDRRVLTHVVDTTPAKQGRYIPGTGVPIVAPGDAPHPDTYLLLAHNYLSTIVRQEQTYEGRWIVPIPAPVLL